MTKAKDIVGYVAALARHEGHLRYLLQGHYPMACKGAHSPNTSQHSVLKLHELTPEEPPSYQGCREQRYNQT